jgi:hypothetical protein
MLRLEPGIFPGLLVEQVNGDRRQIIKTLAVPAMSEVSIERLERALALCAYLVVLEGPRLAPIFNRLEQELAAARAKEDAVVRAKRLLESYKDRGGLKAIR